MQFFPIIFFYEEGMLCVARSLSLVCLLTFVFVNYALPVSVQALFFFTLDIKSVAV